MIDDVMGEMVNKAKNDKAKLSDILSHIDAYCNSSTFISIVYKHGEDTEISTIRHELKSALSKLNLHKDLITAALRMSET
jgi:hypothetical protein